MSDMTKTRILDAAGSILRAEGIDALTVEAAADLAGVSRKTVYNHFGNRYALIDEATSQWMRSTIDHLEDIAHDESRGFIERLNMIVSRGFAELRNGGRLLGDPRTERSPSMQEPYRNDLRRQLRGFIQGLVEGALGAGLVRADFDARRLTWVVVNIIEGLLFIDGLDDEPFARFDILKDSLRAVLSGILTAEGGRALEHSPIFS